MPLGPHTRAVPIHFFHQSRCVGLTEALVLEELGELNTEHLLRALELLMDALGRQCHHATGAAVKLRTWAASRACAGVLLANPCVFRILGQGGAPSQQWCWKHSKKLKWIRTVMSGISRS